MARQFCPTCPPENMPNPQAGRWVEIDGHPHGFPKVRAHAYLYYPGDERPWASFIPITSDWHETNSNPESHWLGWESFATQAEAIEHGRLLVAQQAELIKSLLEREKAFMERPANG